MIRNSFGVFLGLSVGILLVSCEKIESLRTLPPKGEITLPQPNTFGLATISPLEGSLAGSYSVTITGQGFHSGMQVHLGSNLCTNLILNSAESLSCTAPASTVASSVDLKITASNSEVRTLTGAFQYSATAFSRVQHKIASSSPRGYRDGANLEARFYDPTSVAVNSSASYAYVTDVTTHIIRRIDMANGQVTTISGKVAVVGNADNATGTEATFNQPTGLALDHAGQYLYVADYGNHRIRRVSLVAPYETTTIAGSTAGRLDHAEGLNAKFRYPTSFAIDAADDFLYVSDFQNHQIRRIALNDPNRAVTTIAGSTAGFADHATGTSAQFRYLRDIVLSASGAEMYVADYSNSRIRKIIMTPPFAVSTIAGSVSGFLDATNGTLAKFNQPSGILIDPTGQFLLVSESANHTIRRVELSGLNPVSTFSGSTLWGEFDGALTNSARYFGPRGLGYSTNFFLVADTRNHKIRKVTWAGDVTTFAGLNGAYGLQIGAALSSQQLNVTGNGTGLAIGNGKVFFTQSGGHVVQSYDPVTETVSTVVGSLATAGKVDSIGPWARLNSPSGIFFRGNILYLSDTGNHLLRWIDPSNWQTGTLAGSTSGAVDGFGSAAKFSIPQGLFADSQYVYLADRNNHRIRRVTIGTAEVITLAGNGIGYVDDADGSLARFNHPTDVVKVGSMLYVLDSGNQRIRSISLIPPYAVTTIAGSTKGYQDSPVGQTAMFSFSNGVDRSGLTVDGDGSYLYVADTNNHAIRKINLATTQVSTLFGGPTKPQDKDGLLFEASIDRPASVHWDASGLWISNTYGVKRVY